MSATTATIARREVLVVKGLSAGYGPMRVIHDLDLVAHSGERIGLVGLNGHGKSTLFYAIAGLTDWQRGSIKLNGVEVGRTVFERAGVFIFEADLPPAGEYKIAISASPAWEAPPDDRVFTVNIGLMRLTPGE